MITQSLFDPSQFTQQSLLNNATFPPKEEEVIRRQRGPVGGVGLFADGIDTDVGLGQTRTRSQREVGTNLPPQGDQFTPDVEAFKALGFGNVGGSTEELMQQTADTMASIKKGDLSNPNAAAEAASFVQADAEAKGSGSIDIQKPEGMSSKIWKGFNDEFDLTTIGLTLLATNGNGQNLAANLGFALQAGKASKDRDTNKKLALEDRDLNRMFKETQVAESKARISQMNTPSVKNALEEEKLRLDVIAKANANTDQQAKPNVTETNVAATDTRKFFGYDVDEDLDPEESAAVKSFENLYSASQAGVRNGLKAVNITGLTRAEQTALAQVVMIRNNPALLDTLGDNGFGTISPEIQGKITRLLATPNGEALLSSLTSTTF